MEPKTNPSVPAGPLQGVKVIEYGVFHAGPMACSILGDLGAEVIKIETGTGDPVRHWSKVGRLDMALSNGESYMYHVSNRSKRGIWLNVDTEEGREIVGRLVAGADVFLTNLRKSTKTKLGIDYPALSAINPRLIHASISGYGPEGPMSDLGAFDPLGLARSGLIFATGASDPKLLHLGVLDQATAISASHAILAALYARERTGRGEEVHVSLYSTGIWLMHCNLMIINGLGADPTTAGDRMFHSPLRNCFQCRDGEWILGTHHPEDRYWPLFCRVTGRPELAEDSRFATDKGRAAHCPELIAIFDQVFLEKNRDEWMEIFSKEGLMFGPALHGAEIRSDPQAQANGYLTPMNIPEIGQVDVPGYPALFSEHQATPSRPSPGLGEHTQEVLKELGYAPEQIDSLRSKGVIR